MRRQPSLLVLALVVLLVPARAHADLNLAALNCVRPVAVVHDEKNVEIDRARLQESLLGKVRARLPGLRVEELCANTLFFRVVIVPRTSEEGRPLGYLGAARLELVRTAILTSNLTRTEVTAWQATTALAGPPGEAGSAITGTLGAFVDAFAGAYHAAGNP